MTHRIEDVILCNLIHEQEYCRKVLPFIEDAYFDDHGERVLYSAIRDFFGKHNTTPTAQILKIELEGRSDLKQTEFDTLVDKLDEYKTREANQIWLLERTEKFCKDQAIYLSITESLSILEGRNTKFNREAIPSLLQNALSISFDKTVGHDYFDDASKRFEFYHLEEDRIPFDLDIFNKITRGGLPRKTLSCIMAGTNTGKSYFMCHHSAACLKAGYNVLYITLEMAEERIAERIDCNMMGVTVDQLSELDKTTFDSKISREKAKTQGKLVIKEYPTGGASVVQFESLLEELSMKKGFRPDIIMVDYLNICASFKYKSNNYNSYFAIKAIAEELRGLAVKYNVAMITATQTNRSGMGEQTDMDLTEVSESAGTPMTMDFMVAMMRTEDLDEQGQIMFKQLKTRFNDINYYKRFVVASDISKFTLSDVEQPQKDFHDAGKVDSKDKFKTHGKFNKPSVKSDSLDTTGIDFD